jgi:hypothetical protein
MSAVVADPDPDLPPTQMIVEDSSVQLIVNDVDIEYISIAACDLAFLNYCPTQDNVNSGPNEKLQNVGVMLSMTLPLAISIVMQMALLLPITLVRTKTKKYMTPLSTRHLK